MTSLSRLLRPLLALSVLLLMPPLQAAETIRVKSAPNQTAVIELYTSEGCSSCPAADQWFEQLIKLPPEELNMLALAFHVDYWDYIGWKDRFASPAHSNRQRHLARINQQQSVYTPEFFVDGVETRGTRRIIENARKANQQKSSVDLELTIRQDENRLQLELNSHFKPDQHPVVRFVVFEDKLSSDVDHGENAGLQLRHERVVRYFSNRQPLTAEVMHQIKLDPQWQRQHLGVGALVLSDQGEYLQAVYSLLGGQKL